MQMPCWQAKGAGNYTLMQNGGKTAFQMFQKDPVLKELRFIFECGFMCGRLLSSIVSELILNLRKNLPKQVTFLIVYEVQNVFKQISSPTKNIY